MPADLSTPAEPLFRIGRAPSPLDFPPWDRIDSGRFDDPHVPARYRVLYAGERRACFYESLASFRVALDGVAAQGITAEWLASRQIAAIILHDPGNRERWLDLSAPETFHNFRTMFSRELQRLRLPDFDVSAATSEKRLLTQAIAGWAFEAGYRGIRYLTRHAPTLYCWALFEGASFKIVDPGSAILLDDDDFQTVVRQWQLPIP